MGEVVWRVKGEFALEFVKERVPSLPAELTSDAWFGMGVK